MTAKSASSTLREQFAGQFMAAALSNPVLPPPTEREYAQMAKRAVQAADALVAELAK